MRASLILRSAPVTKPAWKRFFPPEVFPLAFVTLFVAGWSAFRLGMNYTGEEVREGHQRKETARLPDVPNH